MLSMWCSAYSKHELTTGSFLGTTGTSHHDDKGEIQVTKFMSMRVPTHDTGAELFVVAKKYL